MPAARPGVAYPGSVRPWAPRSPAERRAIAARLPRCTSRSVQVLTNAGELDRDKQIAVVSQFTSMVAGAAGDPELAHRTWVLLTEATPGGWGLDDLRS